MGEIGLEGVDRDLELIRLWALITVAEFRVICIAFECSRIGHISGPRAQTKTVIPLLGKLMGPCVAHSNHPGHVILLMRGLVKGAPRATRMLVANPLSLHMCGL